MSLSSPAVSENAALNAAILERGQFYFPAGMHYGNPDGGVNCDRCRRTALKACIGFDRYDYCLPCVEAVAAVAPRPADLEIRLPRITRSVFDRTEHVITAMSQDMYRTLMVQDMFDRAPQTRMMQNMFRREPSAH
jgi:hypothetical protein